MATGNSVHDEVKEQQQKLKGKLQLQPLIADHVININPAVADSVLKFLHKMSLLITAKRKDPTALPIHSLLLIRVQHSHTKFEIIADSPFLSEAQMPAHWSDSPCPNRQQPFPQPPPLKKEAYRIPPLSPQGLRHCPRLYPPTLLWMFPVIFYPSRFQKKSESEQHSLYLCPYRQREQKTEEVPV